MKDWIILDVNRNWIRFLFDVVSIYFFLIGRARGTKHIISTHIIHRNFGNQKAVFNQAFQKQK